jgi:lactoylglutathione lyase
VHDVDEAYRTLRERGVQFLKEPHDTPWGGRIALFADPDGNRMQLVQVDWQRYFAACAPK